MVHVPERKRVATFDQLRHFVMDAAQTRRDRLKALKAQVEGTAAPAQDSDGHENKGAMTMGAKRARPDDEGDEQAQLDDPLQLVKFRNYKPVSDDFKTHALPKQEPTTVEQEAAKLTLSRDELVKTHEVDLLNLAPRKPNWDLKRDVDKRLAKLEKQTKRAIAELLRERILQQNGGNDNKELAGAVAAHENLDDDDE